MDANVSKTPDDNPSWTLRAISSQRLLWIGPGLSLIAVLTVLLVQPGIVALLSGKDYLKSTHIIVGLWGLWLVLCLIVAIITLVTVVTVLRTAGKLATRIFVAVLFAANSMVSLLTLGVLILWLGSPYTAIFMTVKLLGSDTAQQFLEHRWPNDKSSDTSETEIQR